MTTGTSKNTSPAITWAGFFYLSIVYVVWGSTFLAIRLTVREGAGFPPFTMGAMRLGAASFILLAWAVLRGQWRVSGRDLVRLAISGIALWVGGNGLVVWAEQYVDSGYAALLVGSAPIWSALLDAILDRRTPSLLLVLSLLVGLAGVAVLTLPGITLDAQVNTLGIVAVLVAAVIWAIASVYQRRNPVVSGSRTSSGYQQLFGALGYGVVALLAREPAPTPIPEAWLAWGYLVIFGSVIAYTAFVMSLKTLPTNVVLTHAYVNPVIAVLLGWLILREQITLLTIAGAGLVLLGVAGVFRDRRLQTLQAAR
jgi:drug/metabolite transporter (DMT)-like permease